MEAPAAAASGGQPVVAQVYDVTNSGSERTNATILQINRIFKDGVGLGGVFHCAIQVYGDVEWSFGYCDFGSGVFSCTARENPMYTFRESIVLGRTNSSPSVIRRILSELSSEWPGNSYDLLSRNCNHFCDAFCDRLDIPRLPGWVNRFANTGDAVLDVIETTADALRVAKTEIVNVGKAAYGFFANFTSRASALTSSSTAVADDQAQKKLFRNIGNVGIKPSSSISEFPDGADSDSASDYEFSEDEEYMDDDQRGAEENAVALELSTKQEEHEQKISEKTIATAELQPPEPEQIK